MNFESILNYVAEKPKQMLSEFNNTPTHETECVLYHDLKNSNPSLKHLDYILSRLESEFIGSLEAANQKNQ